MGEHINTFGKGMSKDYNILFQPDGTYRHMVNCDLISQDGNNYSIKDCHGNVLTFTINQRYGHYTYTKDLAPSPIAFISFPDQLIVLSTNAESTDINGNTIGGYGEIGKINYQPYGQGIAPVVVTGNNNAGYVPLYHHPDLNFSKLQRIEGFAFEESGEIKRIYWTDNFNEPRAFNVGNPIFTTYIDITTGFVDGKTYMVVEGIIKDTAFAGKWYGPTIGTSAGFQTNIFTYNSATMGPFTDSLTPNPIAKVIEYYPLELLDFIPSRSLATMKYLKYGTGNVLCGEKVYFHRLYSSSSNVTTSWSYGSAPVHVGTDNSIPSVPSNFYFDFTGGGNSTTTLNSGKSVFITIDGIDQNFDRIQVACAEYDQITDVPRQITIISDDLISGTSMDIEHTGNNNLGELTLSDITSFPASIKTVKSLTTNKNYILAGNITEREEFDYDTSGITATEIEHKFPVHTTNIDYCNWVLEYPSVMVQAELTSNPSSVIEYTQWVVTAGTCTYNATVYNVGEPFTAVPGGGAPAYGGGGQIRPCVYKQRYVETGGNIVYDITLLKEGFWTYKDPAVANNVKGYWSSETYRFGILFYDLKGNPFFVRWITDFQFEDLRTSGISETNDYYSLKAKGLVFDGIQITEAVANQISGFSIVRADRDANIITQGMLWQTSKLGSAVEPVCFPKIQASAYPTTNDPYYTLICPDRLCDHTMPDYMSAKQVKEAAWLKTVDFNGGVIIAAYGKNTPNADVGAPNQWQTESRMIEQLPDDAYVNEQNILTMQDVTEGASITNFGTSNLSYLNRSEWAAAAGVYPVNNDCFAGAPYGTYGTYDMSTRKASAGMRTVIELQAGLTDSTRLTSYGDMNAVTGATPHKLLVNLTNNKTVFYGGQSDSAKANTLYISTGHFQPINASVLAAVETAPGSKIYEFNGIHIWGGDCFISLVDYGAALADDAVDGTPNVYSMGIKFPCQTNANYELRRGRTVSNNRMHGSSTGVVASYLSNVRLEGFSYNKGYSSEGIEFAYPALPVNKFSSQVFKERIRFAGQKTPNELIDSFRTFLINDYKDLDGQGGEINNLKTKNGKTIVWQNKIISTVPILEREVIAGSSGTATSLGTGGVVDRFDPIDSYFGNQHQWSVIETEYGFAWFDMRRKAFVVIDAGTGIGEVSFIEGLKTFFNEVFLETTENSAIDGPLLNSPTYDKTSDRPIVGTGITGVYDPKTKMTYMTFKFSVRSKYTVEGLPIHTYVNKDFTIGYYHPSKMFVGFYDWFPCIAHNHNQFVISANNPKNRDKYYGAEMQSTTFDIGNTISYNNVEYICISPVTIASYPGTVGQLPDKGGSPYWAKINASNELWVHNQPSSLSANPAGDYQYNKFFGKVVDNEIEFVVNPKTKNPFNVTHGEQKGNNVNITSLTTDSEYQSAADTSISATSKFYKWIYDRITFSYPLSSTGRVADSFLKVKFTKKNWTTSPTTITTSVKLLQYVKSFFQEKR